MLTDGRCRKEDSGNQEQIKIKRGRVPSLSVSRQFYGATYLLDKIGEKIGIIDDLRACFPNNYKMIQSIAYFLILEENNPLFRFSRWGRLHRHPYGDDIASQRSSELFAGITEEQKHNFFRLQGRRRSQDEYWAYDSTSISSYSARSLTFHFITGSWRATYQMLRRCGCYCETLMCCDTRR